MFEVDDFKEKINDYILQSEDARVLAERCRDYYDGKQWTDEEIAALSRRNQAAVVHNKIKPKVNGLLGLLSMRKADPKAYPVTREHESASEVVTDGLRYVADNTGFHRIRRDVADNIFVEGCGAAIVDVTTGPRGDVEIQIGHIPWDRFYYDPHSRKFDFSDARYMGQVVWMDEEELLETFPDVDVDELGSSEYLGDTLDDRPHWMIQNKDRTRYRVAQHFYRHKNSWWMCIFAEGVFLVEPAESPYLDEFGRPTNPIEAESAYVDRANNRYGEVASFLDPQDEFNHRRSKSLHLLSSRQTAGRKGAIKDVPAMKREMAKPDGHVEYQGEKGDFEILNTQDMTIGQLELMKQAAAELDSQSFNAQLAGERQQGDLSGKAIQKLQAAGVIELNDLYDRINNWEKRIYRQVWARIKQFWDEEKWIRVTDDEDALRWVGFNTPLTVKELLEETINDDDNPEQMRVGASAAYQQMMQTQDPRLDEVVEVRNDVAELDMDIKLDQSFDSVNVQQEQFELLIQFAQSSKDIDIIELIELSQLRGKDELIEKIEARREQAAQMQGNIAQAQAQQVQVDNAKKFEDAKLVNAKAQQTQIETALMMRGPDPQPQVIV